MRSYLKFAIVFTFTQIYLSTVLSELLETNNWNESEVSGYHFHTYFFQNNILSTSEALNFRQETQLRIESGFLDMCHLNSTFYGPRGPHPVGSFETCCNRSGISSALSWFMQNHGNLSVLLHPLTRWEVTDHSDRAMFLGKPMPLDYNFVQWDLRDARKCIPPPFPLP